MPRYAAVLDACALVPVALADTLLRVAEKGLYRPLWSDRILAEAREAVEDIHPGISAQKRFTDMREAFDDALVTGQEGLETGIRLPDEDDRHVVAAITMNWRGRPLVSHEVIVETISAVTTRAGLTVKAVLDTGIYPRGIRIPDKDMKVFEARHLRRHEFHGEWNYTIPTAPPGEATRPSDGK